MLARGGLVDGATAVEVRAISNVALADPSPDPSTPEPGVGDSAADSVAQADEKKASADRTEAAEA